MVSFKITSNIYALESKLGSGFVRSYLIVGDRYSVLTDTGLKNSGEEVIEMFNSLSLSKKDLKLIINTHGHQYHIGSNSVISKICGSLIMAHERAVPWIEDHKLQFREFLGRFPQEFPPSKEDSRLFWQGLGKERGVDIQFKETILVKPGKNVLLSIIPTPGHTPGSISVFESNSQCLISGDSFVGKGFFSVLSQYEDVNNYLNSIKRVQKLDIRRILSAHSSPIEGKEKVRNFLSECAVQVAKVERAILDVLGGW